MIKLPMVMREKNLIRNESKYKLAKTAIIKNNSLQKYPEFNMNTVDSSLNYIDF